MVSEKTEKLIERGLTDQLKERLKTEDPSTYLDLAVYAAIKNQTQVVDYFFAQGFVQVGQANERLLTMAILEHANQSIKFLLQHGGMVTPEVYNILIIQEDYLQLKNIEPFMERPVEDILPHERIIAAYKLETSYVSGLDFLDELVLDQILKLPELETESESIVTKFEGHYKNITVLKVQSSLRKLALKNIILIEHGKINRLPPRLPV